MKGPFFSIVIPLYNRSELFKDRLNTILQQDYRDFEVIIVDDGSTDNPELVLKSVLEKNVNVFLIRQQNSERGAARNTGIKNAKGIYIVLFDSDDFMHKDHLLKLHLGIIENKYPDFIATKFNFQTESGKIVNSEIQNYKKGIYDYKLFLNGNPLACNICFKKDIPDLILFEEDRNYAIKEDWMFLITNLKNHNLILLDATTISMYDHPMRSMKSDNDVIIARTIRAVEWIKNHISLSDTEVRHLYSHQNYFCGIHAYLEGDRKSSISYSTKALLKGGLKLKYLTLLAKSIIGRKLILKAK